MVQRHAPINDRSSAQLYKKGDVDKSRLCYLGYALMESRNGLVVDAVITLVSGAVEHDTAFIMAGRSIKKAGATLGADKGYDAAAFVKELRGLSVTPHVAQKNTAPSMDALRATLVTLSASRNASWLRRSSAGAKPSIDCARRASWAWPR